MCFTLMWLQQLLIQIVILAAIIGILNLLVPYILAKLGTDGGIIMAAIKIVVWAIIAIFVIYICFALISCLGSFGNYSLVQPHR